MNELLNLLRTAGRRMELNAWLNCLHGAAIIAAAIALLLIVVDRLPAASFVPWQWVAPALGVIAAIAATILWRGRRLTNVQVALAVDERLDLRERMTTALHCQNRDDPFAHAAMEDAVRTARDPRTGERVRRSFKLTAPAGWWLSPSMLLLALGVWILPQADLFSDEQPQQQKVVTARSQASQTIEAVAKTIETQPELQKELADLVGELTAANVERPANASPEQVKREAIKTITEVNRKLQDIVEGEKGKTARALENQLNKLKPPSDTGVGKELAEALNKGDFQAAKEAINKMMQELEKGEMSPEQKQQVAEQLADIAKQLQELAQQQQQLENALQQAGLDPQLAQNPEALQQALEQNQNLNQQQKQQLQQMAQAQQAANQMMQNLGGMCQQMANGMNGQGGGQNGMGQLGQQMGDQLSQMEQMQMLLQQAQAAMGQCQGLGQKLGQGLGMCQGQGGMGGWGQGSGGKAPIARTPSGTKLVKANIKNVDGEIIARTYVDGPLREGASTIKVKQVPVSEILEGYDEAISEDEMPRKYHDVQGHYFGELPKLLDATEADAAPAPSSDEGK